MGSLTSHKIKKHLKTKFRNSNIQKSQNITGINMMKFTIRLPVKVKHYSAN